MASATLGFAPNYFSLIHTYQSWRGYTKKFLPYQEVSLLEKDPRGLPGVLYTALIRRTM